MEEGLYFITPIWLICAFISFFFFEDWNKSPWSTGLLSLFFGPIGLVLKIFGKITQQSPEELNKKSAEIKLAIALKEKLEKDKLIETIQTNKSKVFNRIELLQFETDIEKRKTNKEGLLDLLDRWRKLEAITEEEYLYFTKKLEKII